MILKEIVPSERVANTQSRLRNAQFFDQTIAAGQTSNDESKNRLALQWKVSEESSKILSVEINGERNTGQTCDRGCQICGSVPSGVQRYSIQDFCHPR